MTTLVPLRRCFRAVSNPWASFRKGTSLALAYAVLLATTSSQQSPLVAMAASPQIPVQKPNAAQPPGNPAAYGIELYRGLFFASGPVGQMIPTMQKLAPYLPTEYKQLEGPMIAYIQRKDPGFFARFASQIQSGNHVEVANALNEARPIHKEALLEVAKISQPEFAKRLQAAIPEATNAPTTPQYKQIRMADRNPEVDVTLAVELALFLLVVLVLAIFAKTTPPPNLQGITFDKLVDEIVVKVPRRPPA